MTHDVEMSDSAQSSEQASEQASDESQQPDQPQEAIAGWRLAVIFTCLAVFLLLAFMDETIVATALIQISKSSHGKARIHKFRVDERSRS